MKRNKCIDCGILLGAKSFWRRAKRCPECHIKWMKISFNNSNFRHGETLKKHYCVICKTKEICYNNFYNGTRKCRSCASKEIFKINPENNPWFVHGNGRSHYSSEFTNKLKEQIRKRDNHKCQLCNKSQEQELKNLIIKLAVHHIDYNKENCNKNNLITLCHNCHSITNGNRKHWTKFYSAKILTIKDKEKI
jgi:5-methylcytosine-specific restriction endonuclease McrA